MHACTEEQTGGIYDASGHSNSPWDGQQTHKNNAKRCEDVHRKQQLTLTYI